MECDFRDGQGFTVIKPKDWKEEGYLFPPNEDYRCEHSNCFMHNFEYETSLTGCFGMIEKNPMNI